MYMRSYGETEEHMHDLWAIYVNKRWPVLCPGTASGAEPSSRA
jgi:hypothetical protein